MAFESNPEKRDQAKFMFDIGREGISFNGYGELGDVVQKFTNHPDICIVRIKDRLSSMEKTTPCGWADVLINFYFVDDPEHHIVEVSPHGRFVIAHVRAFSSICVHFLNGGCIPGTDTDP